MRPLLTISDTAYALLSKALRDKPVTSPVVCLTQSTDAVSPDGLSRVVHPNASNAALREAGLLQHKDSLQKARWSLEASIFPRVQIPGDSIVKARGISFSFSPAWQASMDGWLLDAVDDRLVLKDAAGKTLLPYETGGVTFYGA
jgi:hypothetical protein